MAFTVQQFLFALTVVVTTMRITASQTANEVETTTQSIKPLGKFYSISSCDFKTQPGYTCIGCKTALHCYSVNSAIRVDCHGWFPYCRNGRCSMTPDSKCLQSEMDLGSTNGQISSSTLSLITEEPAIETTSDQPNTRNECNTIPEEETDTIYP